MTTKPKETRTPSTAVEDLLPKNPERIVENVRDYYAQIAQGKVASCCGKTDTETAQAMGYAEEDLAVTPQGANLGLGCGAPIEHLELKPGEVVLDLGSGAGFDAFLAAPKVGPTGKVIGVDMTPEMIERGRENARKASFSHIEFRRGRLEALPVEDASIDAVTSNCVINLVPDKAQVFREVARVLKPGGRLVISDVILDARLPEAVERDVLAHGGCISGAMLRETYLETIRAAGLSDIQMLKDVDYLEMVIATQPAEEVRGFEERTGVRLQDMRGKVRSVTYRAVKAV